MDFAARVQGQGSAAPGQRATAIQHLLESVDEFLGRHQKFAYRPAEAALLGELQQGFTRAVEGSHVQARIEGEILENSIVIPRELYRKNEYVVVIDDDGTLRRKSIEIEWSDEENLVVSSGLSPGDRVCLTHLSFPSEGMKVAVVSEDGIDIANKSAPQGAQSNRVVR